LISFPIAPASVLALIANNGVDCFFDRFGSQAKRTCSLKLSTKPLFLETLRDVVDFHRRPRSPS
jgi:hypothetical protein